MIYSAALSRSYWQVCVYSNVWIVVRKFYNVAFSEEKENIQAEMSVSATTLNLDKMVF